MNFAHTFKYLPLSLSLFPSLLKSRGIVVEEGGSFGLITSSPDPSSTSPNPAIFSRATTPLSKFKWTFVAAVYDGESRTAGLYVDGEYHTTITSLSTSSPSPLTVAGAPASPTAGSDAPIETTLHCKVDDVFVYTGALSKAELGEFHFSIRSKSFRNN